MPRPMSQLTAAEARTAFYVGLEGLQDEAPVLFGTLRKGPVKQFVVERVLGPAGPAFLELRQAVSTVVTHAQKQDRRIVTWGEHDLDIVRLHIREPGLVRAFEARYADGRALAARWVARDPGVQEPGGGDLEGYLGLIAFRVPDFARPGRVEPAIRSLWPSLMAGRGMTAAQADAWADLLAHNRYHCEGLRAVCIRAATDLERLDQRTRKARKGRKRRRPGKSAS